VGILLRHVLPLARPVLASQIAFQAGGTILAEAGLSLLRLGDPTKSTLPHRRSFGSRRRGLPTITEHDAPAASIPPASSRESW
jgi:hypothetical protein